MIELLVGILLISGFASMPYFHAKAKNERMLKQIKKYGKPIPKVKLRSRK